MGGFNLAGSLGFAIGPVAGGLVNEAYGFGPAFVVAGVLEVTAAIVILPVLLVSWRRRP
jgi:MFS family permease